MRHEIIRMEHVNISRPGRHEIEDLNLIICRGYSMGVAGGLFRGERNARKRPDLLGWTTMEAGRKTGF